MKYRHIVQYAQKKNDFVLHNSAPFVRDIQTKRFVYVQYF